MSETETQEQQSVAAEEQAPKAGMNIKKLIIFAVIGLLVIGGGGFGVYKFFLAAPTAEKGEETADTHDEEKEAKPKKKAKKPVVEDEEEEETSTPANGKLTTKKIIKAALPDDENVKQIIELPPFIVNLADADSERYLRLSVSIGIGESEGGGEKEGEADPKFMTRVKNAMLAVISVKSSEEVLSTEGKKMLRKELLHAAQAASEEPHVEAIYITDFIVQL